MRWFQFPLRLWFQFPLRLRCQENLFGTRRRGNVVDFWGGVSLWLLTGCGKVEWSVGEMEACGRWCPSVWLAGKLTGTWRVLVWGTDSAKMWRLNGAISPPPWCSFNASVFPMLLLYFADPYLVQLQSFEKRTYFSVRSLFMMKGWSTWQRSSSFPVQEMVIDFFVPCVWWERDYLDRESALGMKALLMFGWHKFQGAGLIRQAIDFEWKWVLLGLDVDRDTLWP